MLVGIFAGLWLDAHRKKELTYQGLTISQWLEEGDATTPLRALGTNLLPVCIDVLKEKKSLTERFLIQANRVLPECLPKLIPLPADRGFRKYAVLRALPILNCDAELSLHARPGIFRTAQARGASARAPEHTRQRSVRRV